MTSDTRTANTAPHHDRDTLPFAQRLESWAHAFDANVASLLEPGDGVQPRLAEAMRYSALAPGKRLRPYLTTRWCELYGGTPAHALPAAVAVELIHAFSLVHDDLPAMDDDPIRRGQPANHKQFGEAIAILAGDALLTLAFEIVAREMIDPRRAVDIVLELARGTGWSGMIGGQAADVLAEHQPPSRELSDYILQRKTASLFQAACRVGAITAGTAQNAIDQAGSYGWNLGCAFQIADDLLDANAEQVGKSVAKDARSGKQTLPAVVGSAQSRTIAQDAVARALAVLEPWGPQADDLRALARFVIQRHH